MKLIGLILKSVVGIFRERYNWKKVGGRSGENQINCGWLGKVQILFQLNSQDSKQS